MQGLTLRRVFSKQGWGGFCSLQRPVGGVATSPLGSGKGGGRAWLPTSLDCRMVRRGIHTVPTMVSQMSPLFHTSTVRPRSSRLISLGKGKSHQVTPLSRKPLGPSGQGSGEQQGWGPRGGPWLLTT